MDGYQRGGYVKYSLKVYLIFITKYRKKLFYRRLKEDVKQYLCEAAGRQNCTVIKMETDIDHVHILIEYSPSQRVSDIAGFMKQYSTYRMWRKYKPVLQKRYWNRKVLWSDGYFVGSIGQVSQATIETYIQNRG